MGSYDFYTRDFNINDLGFFSRPHDHGGYGQLIYREYAQEGWFYRYGFSAVPEARWNWDGVLTLAQVEATAYGDLTNFWRLLGSFTCRGGNPTDSAVITSGITTFSQKLPVIWRVSMLNRSARVSSAAW